MEFEIEKIAAMVADGWKDGECIVAAKIAPDRAVLMAQKLAAIKTAIAHMERELRKHGAGRQKL